MSSVGQLHGRDDRSTWVVRFLNFRFLKVNTRRSRSGNDEIGSSSRQFLFDYKVVNSALTICWLLEVRSLSTLA